MSIENLPFYVGGYFLDRNQGYVVTELASDHMEVEYDDGTAEVFDRESMQIKARIYENMRSEFEDHHPDTSDDYYRTLGFLASNSRFDAELPAQSVSNFLENYQVHSGQQITSEHTGINLLGDVDKWGPELRIYFPVTDLNLRFGQEVQETSGPDPNTLRINNNNFWMRLVRIGFRLGRNHDIEAIRNTIPPDKIASFEEGL